MRRDDGDMMFIEIIKKNDDSHKEEPEVGENTGAGELEMGYFDVFSTRSELLYHKFLMCCPIPSIFLRNPIIIEGCLSNLKIPCNIGHVHIEKAYIDLNSPLNIMTRMLYNWIMKRKLDPRENTNGGVNNFTGRIKGRNFFVGNFTYVMDFMIGEDISSIIDLRLSQVILGKLFVKISNMTHDPPEGVLRDEGDMMFIEIIKKNDDSHKEEPEVGENTGAGELEMGYFDVFSTRSELLYHKYLMCCPIPSIFLRNPIIIEGCLSNLKIPCNIGHVHIEKAYIDLNSPLNIMTRMLYNWIMKRKLDHRENTNGGVNNFTGRIKGRNFFVGNFTYVMDFMIGEDISSIIDLRLSQVILGKLFVKISNMTHDPPEGVVRLKNGTDEITYKMPHKIEQYNSLSDLEREHTKSVYLMNEEDKTRGVEYVMSKILGFYKECLELGPEYATGIADEGEVT
nr:retrotransposon Orf1 [Tanacetum cinerariifolium]